MAISDILDRYLNVFVDENLNKYSLPQAMVGNLKGDVYSLIEELDDFVNGKTKAEHREYLYQRIYEYIDAFEFTEDMSTSYVSYNERNIRLFNENIQLFKDHIIIKLEELGTDLTGEQLSNKDLSDLYDLVKKMSTDIAQLLKNQDDINKQALEKEIEEELLDTIKKSKIYGKKEVLSNLIGKAIYLRNELTSNLLNKGYDYILDSIQW